MKKSTKIIILVLAVLVLATAAIAVIHLTTRDKVPEGALQVKQSEKTAYVDLSKLELKEITGTIVNGKGEEIQVNEKGVAVIEVLKAAGVDMSKVSEISVIADDEFYATISLDEINEEGKAFLAKADDGTMKLVVFGDSNSKRNVRNVIKVDVA